MAFFSSRPSPSTVTLPEFESCIPSLHGHRLVPPHHVMQRVSSSHAIRDRQRSIGRSYRFCDALDVGTVDVEVRDEPG